MKFKSYRIKLITTFLLISIIPIGFIFFLLNSELKEKIIDDGKKHTYQEIINKSDKLDLLIFNKEHILQSMKDSYSLLKENINNPEKIEDINKYLYNQSLNFNSILNFYIATEQGFNYNSRFMEVENDCRERSWYIEAKNNNKTVWSSYSYIDLLTGKKVITLSMPIKNENEELESVIALDIDFNEIHDMLNGIRSSDESTVYLINSEGKKLDFVGKDSITSFNSDNLKDIFINEYGNKTISIDKDYFLVYSTIDSNDWKIVSIIEEKYLVQSLTEVNIYIGVILLLTILVVIMLALIYSKQFSNPLKNLKVGAIELKNRNYDYRIIMNNQDEFDEVANSFNDMASDLKAYYEGIVNRSSELEEMNIELEASYEQLEAALLQLNDSEEKYRVLVENMNDLVWVVDNDFNVSFVNDALENLLEYEKKDIIGKNIKDIEYIWKNKEIVYKYIEKARKNEYKNLEVTLVDKNGNDKIFLTNTKRILEHDKLIGIQGLMRDVTESKMMERKLIRKNNELTTVNKISEKLNSNLNLEWLLNNVSKDLVKLLDISLCTIRTINDDKSLKLIAYSGQLSNGIIKHNADYECKIIKENFFCKNYINFKGLPQICKDCYSEEVTNLSRNLFTNLIPINYKNSLSGIITVLSMNELSDDELNILKSVANQTAMAIENIKLYENLKKSYLKIIEGLVAALDAKDSYTEGHSFRVSKYSLLIAQKLGLSIEECEEIEVAGILHDIGKIGISDAILTKPGKLTDEEYNIITKHPMIGSKILGKIVSSESILNGVRYHHKNYNLKGYPKDIELDELPLEASIIGVADAFDAMTSNRSYRNSLGFENAINEIIKYKGTQFEPKIVDIIVDLWNNEKDKILEIALSKRA